jgi:hypothetical protein
MWNTLKNALIGVTETLGIEIPASPIDLGSLGESATTAVQGLADSATGAIDSATAATDAFAGLPLGDIIPK